MQILGAPRNHFIAVVFENKGFHACTPKYLWLLHTKNVGEAYVISTFLPCHRIQNNQRVKISVTLVELQVHSLISVCLSHSPDFPFVPLMTKNPRLELFLQKKLEAKATI